MPFDFRECFHPDLRDIAEVRDVMYEYANEDGHFLIRNSTSKPGMFTVSVMHDRSIKHINIFQRHNFFYFQDAEFPSIDKLIQYYKSHDVPNIEGIRRVRLSHPIKKSYATENAEKKRKRSFKEKLLGKSLDSSGVHSSNYGHTMPEVPQLPVRRASAGNVLGAEGGFRPAIPLPINEAPLDAPNPNIYYSSIKGLVNHAPELIKALDQEEGNSSNQCDCGLFFDEAELPLGWTMHISREAGTFGRVFFMGVQSQTAWNLPLEVVCELSPDQQDRLKKLLDEYNARNMQKASAASASGSSLPPGGVNGGEAASQFDRPMRHDNSNPPNQERLMRLMDYSPGSDPIGYSDTASNMGSTSTLSSISSSTARLQAPHTGLLPNSYLTQSLRGDEDRSRIEEAFTWNV